MRPFVALSVLFLTITSFAHAQTTTTTTSIANWSVITVRAPYGFEYPSSYFTPPSGVTNISSYEGFLFTNITTAPPTLGHFDKNGKVIGGDYVLMYCADLGTAPITTIWFYGLFPTVDNAVACRYFDNGDGPLGEYEFPLGAVGGKYQLGSLTVNTAVRGTEGTVTLAVVLLDRKHQSLESAWGTTITQVVRIEDSAGPYGGFIRLDDGGLGYHTASFTIGGAAEFKHAAQHLAATDK